MLICMHVSSFCKLKPNHKSKKKLYMQQDAVQALLAGNLMERHKKVIASKDMHYSAAADLRCSLASFMIWKGSLDKLRCMAMHATRGSTSCVG
jgi:hypothetical protein